MKYVFNTYRIFTKYNKFKYVSIFLKIIVFDLICCQLKIAEYQYRILVVNNSDYDLIKLSE